MRLFRMSFPILALWILWAVTVTDGFVRPSWHHGKACFGTANGMATQENRRKLIKDLRDMYSNCTTVYGNLEITGVTLDDLKKQGLESLDFFDNIEEVAGYVLIAYTQLPRISFPRLRIVWGDKTFTAQTLSASKQGDQLENLSFLVISSRLDVLDLGSLRSVTEGRVGVFNTSGLCHWKGDTIDWRQVLGNDYERQNRLVIRTAQNDTCFLKDGNNASCSDQCPYCWGPLAEQCQEIYRTGCAPQCTTGMCFNTSDPLYCCHSECAAGCTGPRNDQCIGCRSMRDEGACVDKCPSRETYNVKKREYVHNPDGKYSWIRDCVKTCPNHLFVFKEGCFPRCPEGHYAESNETICKQCEGPCPKTCIIEQPLSSLNIHDFINCTTIDGYLEIRQDTMNGGTVFDHFGRKDFHGLTVQDLEVLGGVERITQYLFVQSDQLRSLKFLRNLKQIDGRKKYHDRYAFHLTRMDNLRELGLSSLKTILDGDVYVDDNSDLCYFHTLPWKQITAPAPRGGFDLGKKNRAKSYCEREGRVCDELCDPSTGCWGGGPDMCFSCQFFKANQTCVRGCRQFENLYPKDKICEHCHEECVGCKGPGPKNCIACRNVLLDNTCVETCPTESHYENKTDAKCNLCHPNCLECTGPSNTVGFGGCAKCRYAVVHSAKDNMTYCLPELSEKKDCRHLPDLEDYYAGFAITVGLQTYAEKACLRCHEACKSCSTFGAEEEKPNQCECKKWRYFSKVDAASGLCILDRPPHTYNVSNDFYPCHKQCEECFGPEPSQCTKCKHYIDYVNRNKSQFICMAACPEQRPFITKENACTDIDVAKHLVTRNRQTQVISGVVLAAVFLALIIVCTILFIWRRRVRAMKYLEPPMQFEMHPEARPNLSRLRLILDSQLKKGQILGYGAFGTVFRGVWYADDKKTKVLVAIKVLHESNADAQKEMLDEAGIMASMENQHLAQLIGVCVSQQLMLVTPLFPLGNLLDYVQNNRVKIGSLPLLRWCTQIATGMAYLEECRLVHRDLAARNVLVQTPYHVRITDFGLAKMLEYGQEELKIYEGKMPIKWLALECIRQKRYTHKSDVWAFGVTVWELLTFGEKPYKDVPLQQIPYLLEQGVRLPQPDICSMDIYLVLIKCWMVDANSRYSFKELVEVFSHMMKDPGRYLVVRGDTFLRLPSYSSTDRRQMIDKLVESDEDEDVREASDFLRGSTSSPVTPVSKFPQFPPDSDAADSGAIAPHLVQEAARIRPCTRESTSSHRYASDPVKKARGYPSFDKPTVSFETMATDVDNYLVPDSQQRASTSAANDSSNPGQTDRKASLTYLRVISDSIPESECGLDYYEYLQKAVSEKLSNSDHSASACGCDNKEYMMPNNNKKENLAEDNARAPLLESSHTENALQRYSAEAETVV